MGKAESKATKGPWEVVDESPNFRIHAKPGVFRRGKTYIAFVAASDHRDNKTDAEETRANAHLLAAAPTMRDALEMVLAWAMAGANQGMETMLESVHSALNAAAGEEA